MLMSFLLPNCHGGIIAPSFAETGGVSYSVNCQILLKHTPRYTLIPFQPVNLIYVEFWYMCKKKSLEVGGTVPLRHNLIGIWQITSDILHLSRVRVADLVICPPIVGTLDHDDVCARTAELDGVALTGELSTDHCHGNWSTAESYRKRQKRHHHHHCASKTSSICFPSIGVNLKKD